MSASDRWHRHGPLDISFLPAGTSGFDDLSAGAVVLDIEGADVAVASLTDIIRSKAAAGRDKDRRTLPLLRRLLAEEQE